MNQKLRISEECHPRHKQSHLEDCCSEEMLLCRDCEYRRERWFRHSVTIPWIISFALLALCITLELSSARLEGHDSEGYWKETDFETVKKEIAPVSKKIRFTAGLRYNESRDLVRTVHPGLPEYVGTPTLELDAAWEDLIGAVNVFVTAKEQPGLGGNLYLEPDSKLYMAEPTVFHNLHCLNMIRQSLPFYWDYYHHNPDGVLQPHLDHCIDNLRESLMCTGDMTFSPTVWDSNKGRFIPDFEVEHTCRDYDALKKWSLARDSADKHRWKENAARLHEQEHR